MASDVSNQKQSNNRVFASFNDRETVLAVPFADNERVKELGAQWYPAQKLWFVPKGMDVTLFKEWNPRENALGAVATESVLLDSFKNSMAMLGLDTSDVRVDGKWHYASVDTKRKKNNKSGSYIVSFGDDGSTPVGTILNRDSGESFTWRHAGELLTPEQRAKMRAEAMVREAIAARETAIIQDSAAVHAAEIWALGESAIGHVYLVDKGISTEGLKQISGSLLLGYPEFKSESGATMVRGDKNYLLVPMKSESGVFRAVQAIDESGTKIFMKGAQKKGTMMVLGADCFDDIFKLGMPVVSYVEGMATGASFREISGLPVVVCFDAGNLETVVKQTAQVVALAGSMVSVVAADNDQFYVERAVGFLAEKLGLNPSDNGGQAVSVVSGSNEQRRVLLGEAVADGQWHDTAKGTYCATLIHEDDGIAVRQVVVEVVPTGKRAMKAIFANRGLEAARVAQDAIKAAGGNVVMAIPSFKSLEGRPTDWNDLVKREGIAASRRLTNEIKYLDTTDFEFNYFKENGMDVSEKDETHLLRECHELAEQVQAQHSEVQTGLVATHLQEEKGFSEWLNLKIQNPDLQANWQNGHRVETSTKVTSPMPMGGIEQVHDHVTEVQSIRQNFVDHKYLGAEFVLARLDMPGREALHAAHEGVALTDLQREVLGGGAYPLLIDAHGCLNENGINVYERMNASMEEDRQLQQQLRTRNIDEALEIKDIQVGMDTEQIPKEDRHSQILRKVEKHNYEQQDQGR
jgi:putative DNA primase/helicase